MVARAKNCCRGRAAAQQSGCFMDALPPLNFRFASLLALLVSCGSTTPSFSNVNIHANQNNVLSAIMTASVANASKVYVTYAPEGSQSSDSTPDVDVSTNSVSVPMLGLMPNTSYTLRMTAISQNGAKAD